MIRTTLKTTLLGLLACTALTATTAPALALPQAQPNAAGDPPDPAFACHVGLYRLDDGMLVDVAPVSGQGGRWRLIDGRTGRLKSDAAGIWTSTEGWNDRPAADQVSFEGCNHADRLTFDGRTATRVEQTVVETRFPGDQGTMLAGRLILPPGDGPAPIMVEIHGSEASAALDFNWFQRLAPASGIGVFVYDKRGTGGSDGRYNQNFAQLAADAAAAAREARRLAGDRAGRVGFHGGSQGGWVAPLAASLEPADFVIVGYGMAEGVLAEDREEVRQDLETRGWGPEVIAKGREVTDVTGEFVRTHGAVGFEALDAIRAKYNAEPWWKDLTGDFTQLMLPATNAQITAMLEELDLGIMWDYDPMPVLRANTAPLLWILAENDTEAPPEGTRQRLTMLAAEGAPITVVQYPSADHGIIEFELQPDRSRIETRYADGYVQAVLDWAAHGELRHGLGHGVVLARPSSTGGRSPE